MTQPLPPNHAEQDLAEETDDSVPSRGYEWLPVVGLGGSVGDPRELPQDPKHRHVAVDLFFRTLADTHGPHAVAVVLSGLDSDGAIGIKRIKQRGGLTIAQDPAECEHSSMPRSAIGTGMVDWVLPVRDIPNRLLDYTRVEEHFRLPAALQPAPCAGIFATKRWRRYSVPVTLVSMTWRVSSKFCSRNASPSPWPAFANRRSIGRPRVAARRSSMPWRVERPQSTAATSTPSACSDCCASSSGLSAPMTRS